MPPRPSVCALCVLRRPPNPLKPDLEFLMCHCLYPLVKCMADHSDRPYVSGALHARQAAHSFWATVSWTLMESAVVCFCVSVYQCDWLNCSLTCTVELCVYERQYYHCQVQRLRWAECHFISSGHFVYRSVCLGTSSQTEEGRRTGFSQHFNLFLFSSVLDIRGHHPHRCPWFIYHSQTEIILPLRGWFDLQKEKEKQLRSQRRAYWTSQIFKGTFIHQPRGVEAPLVRHCVWMAAVNLNLICHCQLEYIFHMQHSSISSSSRRE